MRGTLRSRAKADAWLEAYPQYAKQLDFALVPDISAPGAFDEAIKGADYVAHTASPFFLEGMKSAEKDMLSVPPSITLLGQPADALRSVASLPLRAHCRCSVLRRASRQSSTSC